MGSRRSIFLTVVLSAALATTATLHGQSHFWRGDTDQSGRFELTDGILVLNWLFLGEDPPDCLDAADVDDDGLINLSDPVQLFSFLFLGGLPPSPPYPKFEKDPTDEDGLSCAPTIIPKSGEITTDETWKPDSTYLLVGTVFVRSGATLTIDPGTTVMGDSINPGVLVIERGARIFAIGEETRPIIFTSDRPVGSRERGDWGGIILIGRGDSNIAEGACGKEGEVEDLPPGTFWGGGCDVTPDDSSGIVSYVRIEYGGADVTANNPADGLALVGVGSGTKLDHIQVKHCADDGVDWIGGSADLKYALCIGIGDDSFGYAGGANFRGQFWVCQQRGDSADRGLQVGRSQFLEESGPLTRPVLSNITLIGDPDENEGMESGTGVLIRQGCGSYIVNAIVAGFKISGVDLDNQETTANTPTQTLSDAGFVGPPDNAPRTAPLKDVVGTLLLDYSVFHDNGPFGAGHCDANDDEAAYPFTTCSFAFVLNEHNIGAIGDSPIVDPYNLEAPDFRPQNDALLDPFDPTTLDEFFEPAPYRGAVPPEGDDWTQAAWISYQAN